MNIVLKLKNCLKYEEARNIKDLDELSTTLLHAKIIQKKIFLKKLYMDFYNRFKRSANQCKVGSRVLVELGSGGGFIKGVMPDVITTDILDLPTIDKNFSVLSMPFENNTIDSYFMIDVLHHISDARKFFKEADRCLKVGGKIVMIEPANTLWSRFIYKNFHHEPFDISRNWCLESHGPLSSANIAIPWIIFCRDRLIFEKEFSSMKVLKIEFHTPLRYLISGGVSVKQILPSFMYNIINGIEMILSPLNRYVGMFMTIEIEKVF